MMIVAWLGLVGSVISVGLNITRIYAFGDSYTDFGNLFKLTQHQKPDPRYYYQGRTSNGVTWIEILKDKLETKPKVVSFAYGGATSDDVEFPAGVPGAKQQIEKDFSEYYQKNLDDFIRHRDSSLVVYAFGGNDLYIPGAEPKVVVSRLVENLRNLIVTYTLPRFVVTVSNGARYTPFTNAMPATIRNEKFTASDLYGLAWQDQLVPIRHEFPNVLIHEFRYRSFYTNQVKKPNPHTNMPWIQNEPCLTPTDTAEFNICSHPENYVYWDSIHPTTEFHSVIADQYIAVINSTIPV